MMHLFSALLDLIRIGRLSEHEKDLAILLLRRQLGIAERKLHGPLRASRIERLTIAVITTKLRSSARQTLLVPWHAHILQNDGSLLKVVFGNGIVP